MEYVAPISCDEMTENQPYVDSCVSMGVRGTETPARFYNLILAEGRNLVEGAGLTLDSNNDAQWKDAVCALIEQKMAQAGTSVPPGIIAAFASENPPEGWLECRGALVSRTDYPELWAFAQVSGNISDDEASWQTGQFSPGDGTTNFRIPDLRGEFIRGWDNGRGLDDATPDPTRVFAKEQGDTIRNITGSFVSPMVSNAEGAFFEATSGMQGPPANPPCGPDQLRVNFDASRVVNVAAETRPRNVALLYCIKT